MTKGSLYVVTNFAVYIKVHILWCTVLCVLTNPLLDLLRLVLWSYLGSALESATCIFEKNVYSAAVAWKVL